MKYVLIICALTLQWSVFSHAVFSSPTKRNQDSQETAADATPAPSALGAGGVSRSQTDGGPQRKSFKRPCANPLAGIVEGEPIRALSPGFDDAVDRLALQQVRAAARQQGVLMSGTFLTPLSDQCAICMVAFGSGSDHFVGPQRTHFPCGHAFCSTCAAQLPGVCPLCRGPGGQIHTEYIPTLPVTAADGALDCELLCPAMLSRTASCAGGGASMSRRTGFDFEIVHAALPATDSLVMAASAQGAQVLHGVVDGTAIVQVAFPQDEIRPLDLVVVLDSSGSMNEVFDAAAEAIGEALKQVPAGSRVTVVSFSDQATQVFPLQTPQASQYSILIDKVKESNIGGGTKLASGLGMAAKILEQGSRPGVGQSLFAITDGDTEGIDEVIPLITQLNTVTNGNFKVCSLGVGVKADQIRAFLGAEHMATKYEHANDVSELRAVMLQVFSLSPATTSTVLKFPEGSNILSSAAAGQREIELGPVCAGQSLNILAQVTADFAGATLAYRDMDGVLHEVQSGVSSILAEQLPSLLKIRLLRIELNKLSNLAGVQDARRNASLMTWLVRLEEQIIAAELGDHYQELSGLAEAIRKVLEERPPETNPAAEVARQNGLAAAMSRSMSGPGRTMSAPPGRGGQP